jgi:UDP-GlcNAc:undecaprenyl-phosphate GlcNAc-1-phosphate transferase
LDTSVAVISRISRHISPFQGGQDHLSHRLVRGGLSRKQAATTLWGLSAFYAAVAIFISRPDTSIENYLVSSAGLLWVVLFVLFFRTKDV